MVTKSATTKARKKVKKNVAEGIATCASFNNTIITITDRQATPRPGNRRRWLRVRARARRLLPRSPPSVLAAPAPGTAVNEDHQHHRHHADSPKRLPPAQKAPRLRAENPQELNRGPQS